MSAFGHMVVQQLAPPAAYVSAPKKAYARSEPAGLEKRVLEFVRAKPNQDAREMASVLDVRIDSVYAALHRLGARALVAPVDQFGQRRVWRCA